MIVIVFLGCHPRVAVNNIVYLPGDRSDCDEFLSTLLSLVGILWLSFYKY